MIKLGFLLNLSRLRHWLLDKAFSILVWNRSVLEGLFRRHSCKGQTIAASLICPKELTLKATTFKIQIVAILPAELLWVCKAWNFGKEEGERSNWGFIFESEHSGIEGKRQLRSGRSSGMIFLRLKPCRNSIADRFSINLLFVFSLVVWDKDRKLSLRSEGFRSHLPHSAGKKCWEDSPLSDQGSSGYPGSLWMTTAGLQLHILPEGRGKGLFCSRGHQSSGLCALGSLIQVLFEELIPAQLQVNTKLEKNKTHMRIFYPR